MFLQIYAITRPITPVPAPISQTRTSGPGTSVVLALACVDKEVAAKEGVEEGVEEEEGEEWEEEEEEEEEKEEEKEEEGTCCCCCCFTLRDSDLLVC